jgi:hypothetical protein
MSKKPPKTAEPEPATDLGHAPVVLDIAGTALSADDRRRLRPSPAA